MFGVTYISTSLMFHNHKPVKSNLALSAARNLLGMPELEVKAVGQCHKVKDTSITDKN